MMKVFDYIKLWAKNCISRACCFYSMAVTHKRVHARTHTHTCMSLVLSIALTAQFRLMVFKLMYPSLHALHNKCFAFFFSPGPFSPSLLALSLSSSLSLFLSRLLSFVVFPSDVSPHDSVHFHPRPLLVSFLCHYLQVGFPFCAFLHLVASSACLCLLHFVLIHHGSIIISSFVVLVSHLSFFNVYFKQYSFSVLLFLIQCLIV